jgi:hypothetical protein
LFGLRPRGGRVDVDSSSSADARVDLPTYKPLFAAPALGGAPSSAFDEFLGMRDVSAPPAVSTVAASAIASVVKLTRDREEDAAKTLTPSSLSAQIGQNVVRTLRAVSRR